MGKREILVYGNIILNDYFNKKLYNKVVKSLPYDKHGCLFVGLIPNINALFFMNASGF